MHVGIENLENLEFRQKNSYPDNLPKLVLLIRMKDF